MVCFARRLSLLDVSRNKMKALPDGLGGCSALVELFLGYNDIEQLPPTLSQLSALRTLELRGNRCVTLGLLVSGVQRGTCCICFRQQLQGQGNRL